MKKIIVSLLIVLCLSPAAAQRTAEMDAFVTDLLSRMTLEEKIGQLNLQVAGDITTGSAQDTEVAGLIAAGRMGGIFNLKGADKIRQLQELAVTKTRLGIPLLVGMDVIHGYETIFPIPLAQSCSWDLDGIRRAAAIAAKEASADGINWVYSPMVDICVDARWGRIAEGNGEDPYLGGEIARAMIEGYQGDYSKTDNVMACVKHFALYGAAEAGRDYNTVDMSRQRMYNQYFPPYKAAADAGVGSFMSSFNLVEGVPASGNRWLLTDLLRGEWGWNGFVSADYGSVGEMVVHGLGNLQQVSAQALHAGLDMDMCSTGYLNTLLQSVEEGRVEVADIDLACRRILEAKYKLGLFVDPYKYCDATRRARDIYTDANRRASRDLAAETFVLLKNKGGVLPLKRQGTIALLGPLANDRKNIAGTWCVAYTPERYATLLEGFQRAVGKDAKVVYAQGCNLADSALQVASEFGKTIPRGDDEQLLREALKVAKKADVIVCALGECADMSGESSSRADLSMPSEQHRLLVELKKLGKPIVLLHFSGRPTVLTWEEENLDAILNVWFAGSEAADAVCDVIFGDKSPSGRLTTTFPQAVGQLPLYYNHLSTGRPVAEGEQVFHKYASNYLDVRNDPLYPFGYGLSYTTFEYSPVTLSTSRALYDETSLSPVTASVTVRNTGDRDADEVVQLYVRDRVASLARPVKELKGFRRIHLRAGESQRVEFPITAEMLSYYGPDLRLTLDAGEFDIMVGPNSRDTRSALLTVE